MSKTPYYSFQEIIINSLISFLLEILLYEQNSLFS